MAKGDTKFTVWVAEHPWRWAVLSGSLLTAWGLALFRAYPIVWLSLGAIFGLVNGWIWRPTGPAHCWRASLVRRFPKKR